MTDDIITIDNLRRLPPGFFVGKFGKRDECAAWLAKNRPQEI